MNTHAVHESIRLLPPDSAAYGPKTWPLEAHQRWAKATYDPQLAWRIAVRSMKILVFMELLFFGHFI
jgi:hypothetical protein